MKWGAFGFFLFVLRYITIVNLTVIKRLGIAGMLFFTCLGEQCNFALFIGIWFVIELSFQFFIKWYVLLFAW